MNRFIYVLFVLFMGLFFMTSNVQAQTNQGKKLTQHVSKMEKGKKQGKVKKEKTIKKAKANSKKARKKTKATAQKININTANAKTLQTLPGIGIKIAQRIVEYRKTHPFTSTKDLLQVKGIGKKILSNLLPLITVR